MSWPSSSLGHSPKVISPTITNQQQDFRQFASQQAYHQEQRQEQDQEHDQEPRQGSKRARPMATTCRASISPVMIPGSGSAQPQPQPQTQIQSTTQRQMPSPSDLQMQSGGQRFPPRTRGPTACQTCRSRKTKCDCQRPVCGYCLKVGGQCLYIEDEIHPNSCHVFGPQILTAVNDLAQFVHSRLDQTVVGQFPKDHHNSNAASTAGRYYDSLLNGADQSRLPTKSTSLSVYSNETRTSQNPLKGGFAPHGVDDVVNWNVFDHGDNAWTSLPGLLRDEFDYSQSSRPPSIELPMMMELRDRYIAALHVKNPFLNISQLDKRISNVVELGFDWSVEACLVALVCAIGAVSEPIFQLWDGHQRSNLNLAMQFWNVAVRRLGYAVGEHNLEAAQCLCLAGIWYMNILQPIKAWKYFNLAGSTRLLMMLRREPPSLDMQQTLTLEQALYFTIYKSEYELRAELALPPSVLSEADPLYTFPVPPKIDINNAIFDTELSWYYYLAEIASRHLFNRLLYSNSSLKPGPKLIENLLSNLEVMEAQIDEWYRSLPSVVSFDLPHGELIPELKDDLRYILRSRYMTVREHLYRPFVRLCVEEDLGDTSAQLVERLAHIASEGLRYATYRLQVPPISRHQGLWFHLRNLVTCSMELIAMNRAQSRPDRFAAQRAVLPPKWKQHIAKMLATVGSFAHEPAGGCAELYQLLVEQFHQTT